MMRPQNLTLSVLIALLLTLALLSCADKPTESALTEEDVVHYPGAPTIAIKLTSRSPEQAKYYLESDMILPYDIQIRLRAQGTCTTDGKTHNFDGDLDIPRLSLGTAMKQGTARKHFDLYFSPFWSSAILRGLLETNVNGVCLIKTLTLSIKPWPGTDPGAYNAGSPSRLTLK